MNATLWTSNIQNYQKQNMTIEVWGGDSSVVECPPLNWKLGIESMCHWVNHCSTHWARAFAPTTLARNKFQASACCQLLSPKSKQKKLWHNNTTFAVMNIWGTDPSGTRICQRKNGKRGIFLVLRNVHQSYWICAK